MPKRPSSNRSAAEDAFEEAIIQIGAQGQYVREYRFSDETDHRADFAFPQWRILVEIDGNIWVKGGHSSGAGILRDIAKTNLAAVNGWTLLRFDTGTIRRDMAGCIDILLRTIAKRKENPSDSPSA